MSNLSDRVPIPPANLMNSGLHAASEASMIRLLGVPGRKTDDCSDPTGEFARHVVSRVDVGPFHVSGFNVAVESLRQVFAELKRQAPDVYAEVSTEGLGMLCVRHRRPNPNVFSNHSWGTAIDLKFGSREVAQGLHVTQRGFLTLYPIFNQFGWYWGAGFSGGSVDSMHFELAEETIARMIVTDQHVHLAADGEREAAAGAGTFMSPLGEPVSAGTAHSPEAQATVEKITKIAADSQIANYDWNDRGRAPLAYMKGMALVYARTYTRLGKGDPFALEMAKADSGNGARDALTHYRSAFDDAGMKISEDGVDTLRSLFVLMLGLGMRETSGKYCTGRDGSVHDGSNKHANTAEAGLFQASFNVADSFSLLKELFARYRKNPNSEFLDAFSQNVHCHDNDGITWGEGDGAAFQKLSKSIPEFAAEFAAIGLRHDRKNWGPITRQEAEIVKEADDLFRQVQDAVDSAGGFPV